MPLIARQRSRLAVLAVLALVGSLLAVSAVPVAADHNKADDTADAKAMYSACVGAATDDAGFTDMGNSFAADAANCLAHYGITLGTGDGAFSPDRAVTRLQMARFLSRAAGPAGIDTMMVEASGADDVPEGAEGAVDTVVSLGIMDLRDGSFNPADAVTRKDMAVHIAAFLGKALTGPGGTDIDDLKNSHASGKSPFTDIEQVSVSAHKAIRDIFELGVTTGTTDTTFSPDNPVTRAQMAAFITRALGHTNARPAGISAQGPANVDTDTTADISVSVRDDDHGPVPDALVAAITSDTPDEAFDDEGACADDAEKVSGDCAISTSNEATDPDGNAELQVDTPAAAGTRTVWVWTGDSGDKFDADTTDRATLEMDAALPAANTNVTDDSKENAKYLKFGDTVTYTFQVVNSEDGEVAKEGASVTVLATITDMTDGTGRGPAAQDGSATDAPDANANETGLQLRSTTETTTTVHKTDASGRIEISFTQDDPDGDTDNQDKVVLTLTLTGATHPLDLTKVNDMDEADAAVTTDGIFQAIWVDTDSSPESLTLSQAVDYHEVDSTGGGVGNTVRATLVDQYGDPVSGVKVSFWSSDGGVDTDNEALSGINGAVATPADHRTTNRNGVATKRYTRTGATAAAESIDANYVVVNGTCRDTLPDSGDGATCTETDDTVEVLDTDVDNLIHYWAVKAAGPDAVAAGNVLVADKDNNRIVVATGTATVVTYKDGDHFQVGPSGSEVSSTLDNFEKLLSVQTTPAADQVGVVFNATSKINTFSLVDGNPSS